MLPAFAEKVGQVTCGKVFQGNKLELDTNIFSKRKSKMIDKTKPYWTQKIGEMNPWKWLCIDSLNEKNIFCLPEEKNEKYNQFIPPQPYQGTPNAKIWILLANPGYKDENAPKDGMDSDITFFDKNKEPALKQLIFMQGENCDFCNYILDPKFINYYGRKWFLDRFTGKDYLLSSEAEKSACENNDYDTLKRVDNRFFLLQIHGYASKEYNNSANFKHMEYNKALLRWALANDKIIVIARQTEYWQRVIESVEHDDTKIFVMLNNRNVCFTPRNLVRYFEWKQSQITLSIAKADVKRHFELAMKKDKEN